MKKIKEILTILLILILSLIIINSLYEKNLNSKPQKIEQTYEKYDTDSDGLSDEEEDKLGTDKYKKDSDDDGLTDFEEVRIKTNPLNNDTDGDGLLDGKNIVVDGKIIAPKDSNPLKYNGKNGLWIHHINDYKSKTIPKYLLNNIKYVNKDKFLDNLNINTFLKPENLSLDFIQQFLFFKPDTNGIILHSQTQKEIVNDIKSYAKDELSPIKYQALIKTMEYYDLNNKIDTWQRKFGYNRIYDDVFSKSVNNNMSAEQIYFKDLLNIEYAIWLWKGDYLSLGTGAEIGIYVKSKNQQFFDKYNIKHWDSIDFELPMTLNLYEYSDEHVDTIFNWTPIYKQWWITGFNPYKKKLAVKNLNIVASIDFSEHEDMFNSIKRDNKEKNDILIFDEANKILWIAW